jgi:hypothetical protein
LVESDWVAYEFANRPDVRNLLGIPADVESFRVLPRLRSVKSFTQSPTPVHDIVFKVSWDHVEDNNVGNGMPAKRRITAGSVLVINADQSRDTEMAVEEAVVETANVAAQKRSSVPPYESGDLRLRVSKAGKDILHVRAVLHSDLEQQADRDKLLTHLIQEGLVEVELGASTNTTNGKVKRQATIQAKVQSNVLKLSGTASMLHIAPS